MANGMTQIAGARISNCHQNEAINMGKAAGYVFADGDSASLALSGLPALTIEL
ncbi:hypothetical protein [Croceibacterium ferulae]|uniref:hypothetical protein n=1 Tax=Croceibacterium ferulae TaxID=1854641 RepID=UPI0012D7543A|nr:hypothetical protein [Croceibacterium ferulae]